MTTNENYTTSFTVEQSPAEVFAAIINVRGWWSEEIAGSTATVGQAFDYHFRDIHRCRIEVVDMVPGQKVVWHVLENHFSFTRDKTEWTGTDIIFDIVRKGKQTEVRFSHIGLVPDYECYEACSEGWGTYIGESLRALITTGKGQPNVGEALTESERALV